jgi:DNA-binding transcriptional MerR regulator
MRIGELSKLSGLSRDAIRFYEREGLIASLPSHSARNTYRYYPKDLLGRLAMIGEAREAGIPLTDLRLLLDAIEGCAVEALDVQVFLDARIERLEDSIRQARRFLGTLRATKIALAAEITEQEIADTAQNTNNLA